MRGWLEGERREEKEVKRKDLNACEDEDQGGEMLRPELFGMECKKSGCFGKEEKRRGKKGSLVYEGHGFSCMYDCDHVPSSWHRTGLLPGIVMETAAKLLRSGKGRGPDSHHVCTCQLPVSSTPLHSKRVIKDV